MTACTVTWIAIVYALGGAMTCEITYRHPGVRTALDRRTRAWCLLLAFATWPWWWGRIARRRIAERRS